MRIENQACVYVFFAVSWRWFIDEDEIVYCNSDLQRKDKGIIIFSELEFIQGRDVIIEKKIEFIFSQVEQ